MKITVCDICQSHDNVETYYFQTGTQIDPPSGRTETTYAEYDLCPLHFARLVKDSTKEIPAKEHKMMQRLFQNMRESNAFIG